MAEIVMGFGTSHGPLLATPPHEWDLRANVDRKNPELAFREGTYDFPALAKLRKDDGFEQLNSVEVRSERWDRCQKQLDVLGERIKAARPDAMLIIGDDHHEWFMQDIQPAFSVFYGDAVQNRALTAEEEQATIARGGTYSMKVYYPPKDETYSCPKDIATHVIKSLMDDSFDVTAIGEQPSDNGQLRTLGHSYGFIYRRILNSAPIPLIPISVNTYHPPNQPSPKRCFEFGRAIARALQSFPGKQRIVVGASGGMTHFVIDEEMDRRLVDAMLKGDWDKLTSEPDIHFRSGTSEIKNWIVNAGMMAETGLKMELLDLVPCYRSEAGTGSTMGFATWN
jgi:OH-DDVA oxygenase